MIDGIINVYKETGFTSHDVVAKLRGILKQKKIGHTGTLDPEAQGVLPVCLGKATKVCELLTDQQKTYQAVMLLGCTTDTQDMTGNVLRNHEVSCTEEEVRSCVAAFIGEQEQIPPMYSALKINGKKLYELARQGIEVERKARRITIEEIVIDSIHLPEVTMTVTCSKGTYIRTLCNDIGEKLGCGGCMKSLLRTQVGSFELAQSVRLGEIEAYRDAGELDRIVKSIDSVFQHLTALYLSEPAERLVRNGNPIPYELLAGCFCTADRRETQQFAHKLKEQDANRLQEGQHFRIYGADQTFLAVYEWKEQNNCLKAVKMFL